MITTNDPNRTTLGELAAASPSASRVLYRLGLDYCCGGKRTLAAACDERGLEPAEVLRAIEVDAAAGEPGRNWADAPLDELIDHIVGHYHNRLREELPELRAMAAKVERRHADKPSCPRGLAACLDEVEQAVLDHLAKEEQILFPLIRAGAGAQAAAPAHAMEREHDDHGKNLARIRSLTADLTPPEEACTTWRTLYSRLEALEEELMEHIHLENNVLFPAALAG